MENTWNTVLESGKKVDIDIRPIYVNGSKRPKALDVFFEIDGVELFKSFCNYSARLDFAPVQGIFARKM